MLPYKVYYPCLASTITAGIGMLSAIVGVPLLLAVAVPAGLALVCVLIASRVVHGARLFSHWPNHAKTEAIRWIGVAGVADVLAVGALQLIGIHWWPVWLLGLLVLTGAQIGTAKLLEFWWLRLPPKAKATPAAEQAASTLPEQAALTAGPGTELELDHSRAMAVRERTWQQLSHDEQVMMTVLAELEFGWLVMVRYELITDDKSGVFGARFYVRVPPARAAEGLDKAAVPAGLAEPIAIGLSARMGVDLHSRWVSIQKQDAAGLYTITTVMEDVTARLYEYRDVLEWASIRKPMVCGYGIDAKAVSLLLAQHGQHIGRTRSGKSSLLNTLLAYMTRCEDCVVWICGTEKLYDLVAGWLECYLGTDAPLPFDWVANGAQDTVDMLCSLMTVARYRQSVRVQDRAGFNTIICIMDEASFALRKKNVWGVYDGQRVTMSQIAGMIGQGAGSAECWLHYATQRDTNDQLGDQGGDIQAQAGFTTAFMISDEAAIGRLMGDYKLQMPRNKGEFWLNDGSGSYPQLVKSPYVQEVDPSKTKLHDGQTIEDISWSRRHFVRTLDEGSQRAAGPKYAARHTRMTDEFLAYLTGGMATPMPTAEAPAAQASTARPSTPAEPATEGAATAEKIVIGTGTCLEAMAVDPREVIRFAELAGVKLFEMTPAEQDGFAMALGELLEQYGSLDAALAALRGGKPATDQPAAPAAEASEPAATSEPTARRDRIVEIVTQAHEPMRSADIIAVLRAAGDPVANDVAVYNLLRQMVSRGELLKLDSAGGSVFAAPGDPSSRAQ